MVVIGLTGGIGAGKSTFAALLAELGAEVVDVDAIGRSVIAEGPGADAVMDRFGTLDRREIAAIVFNDPAARNDLEAISWPLIEDELRRVVASSQASVIVLDMAVLPQGLGKGIYGPVVTVEAPEDVRVGRLVARGMTEDDARARMRSQVAEHVRRDLADAAIDNTGDLAALRIEAAEVLDRLQSSFG